MADKKADLAGPGISTYPEVDKILPQGYDSILDPKETQHAVTAVKRYIEDQLCHQLNLFRVEVPLIVSKESGVNDYLDRDGSRTPVEFPCGLGLERRIETQVVQAKLGRHLHESKPPRLASLPVLYNVDRHDISGIGEKGFEFRFAGLEGKVGRIFFSYSL